ncbi:MAG TPA: Uma2 family endonuclease [Gemmatimonadaceae bacterium]|nr:Uma2 family endonuclease [Gemmatimonadaceae bacterium]
MAQRIRKWTLRDLHALPDDGNKYELVRGELFVTPAPTDAHEELGAVLNALLAPYVARHRLGRVYRPRAVIQVLGSEAEPDLMVRPIPKRQPVQWRRAPRPHLAVEILSDATHRRDREQKRSLYMDAAIPEYWIVDGDERGIRVVRQNRDDEWCDSMLVWYPHGATEPFVLDVQRFFREALEGE